MHRNAIESMNVVIARFEGRKFFGHTIDKFGGDTCNALPEMKYHTSWDWIIPVIQKIKSIHLDILKQAYVMDYMKAASHMNSGLISLKIEEAHLGVYKFLTWHNENQQKNNDD